MPHGSLDDSMWLSKKRPCGEITEKRKIITLLDHATELEYQVRNLFFPKALDCVPGYKFEDGIMEIKERIRQLSAVARPGETLFIGVGGECGSGKTALAKRLGFPVLSMDDYFQYDFRNGDHDRRKGVNFRLIHRHIKSLRHGKAVTKRVNTWDERDNMKELFQPAPIIVVEGLLALDRKLVKEYALKVYVETERRVARERVIERDVRERGRTKDGIIQYFEDVIEPLGKIYTRNTKREADLIIVN